jgi:hypothetical protein
VRRKRAGMISDRILLSSALMARNAGITRSHAAAPTSPATRPGTASTESSSTVLPCRSRARIGAPGPHRTGDQFTSAAFPIGRRGGFPL